MILVKLYLIGILYTLRENYLLKVQIKSARRFDVYLSYAVVWGISAKGIISEFGFGNESGKTT